MKNVTVIANFGSEYYDKNSFKWKIRLIWEI